MSDIVQRVLRVWWSDPSCSFSSLRQPAGRAFARVSITQLERSIRVAL
jgi:hypothetical protein